MKKILISLALLSPLSLPFLVFAQNVDKYAGNLIGQVTRLLGNVLIFLISLAVVWFIWNVIQYAMSKEEDGKDKAKSQMISGIIAIAVIVSVWGIVYLLQTAFGVDNNNGAIPKAGLEMMIPY